MLKKAGIFPVTVFGFLFLSACSGDETYPVNPEIKYKSLEKFISVSGADSLVIDFSFTDGDGDLGTNPQDVTSRDIFAKLYESNNGVFEEAPLAAPLEYRLPFLEPRGNNSSLKGDVRINIDYNVLRANDTIYYTLFIRDRAGHQSNTITSEVIVTKIQ